jgi:NAD(P)-dependent dehydrogenase (short-subunit alcohol dehydrogenase family)
VQRLAEKAYERFGGVHVLCNNAGVGGSGVGAGGIWQRDVRDWQWVLGVNLWGVIHGIHAFVPRMVSSGEEGHVINTASAAGLSPGSGIYGVSKHAVVALSESLRMQLQAARSQLGISVLCPGYVKTNIMTSARNQPEHLVAGQLSDADATRRDDAVRRLMSVGMEPDEVADHAVRSVRDGTFYVLAMQEDFKNGFLDVVQRRADSIAKGD